MRANRCWIEIIALATTIALAVALLIATLGAAAVALADQKDAAASAPTAFEGMVTCSRCGAKHPAAMARTASACVLACVHSGANFALVDGDKVYELDGDVMILKKVAGQRARIMGVAQGKMIRVSSITSAI